MQLDKLKIKFGHVCDSNGFLDYGFKHDEDLEYEEDDYECDLKFEETNSSSMDNTAVEIVENNPLFENENALYQIEEIGDDTVYDICLGKDFKLIEDILYNSGEYFCSYFDIIYNEKEIGSFCFSKIFVNNFESIAVWLDNECPNSMQIGSYICKDKFELLEGRYVGILDEIYINDEFSDLSDKGIILSLISILLKELELNVYHVYALSQPLTYKEHSMNIIPDNNITLFESREFELVDVDREVFCLDVWHSKKRDNISGVLKDVYLP